jgi:hypothetical protein
MKSIAHPGLAAVVLAVPAVRTSYVQEDVPDSLVKEITEALPRRPRKALCRRGRSKASSFENEGN